MVENHTLGISMVNVLVYFIINNEAEYHLKNYRRITPSEIPIIFQMIRKPNSIIVLLFIQNNS